jgi:hypothetical protein
MTPSRRLRALVTAAVLLFGWMAMSGCVVVPVKMKTRVEGPAGKQGALPKDDLVPGVTTRREVEERYRTFRVDTGVPDLYWARYRKSGWGVFVAAYGAGGDHGRLWTLSNLIVTFDAAGTVKTSSAVKDEGLEPQMTLALFDLSAPLLDISQPIPVESLPHDGDGRRHGRYQWPPSLLATGLELTREGVVVTTSPVHCKKTCRRDEPGAWWPEPTTVPLSNIREVTFESNDDESSWLDLVLRFETPTAAGGELKLSVAPSDAPLVLRWWAQVRRGLGTIH